MILFPRCLNKQLLFFACCLLFLAGEGWTADAPPEGLFGPRMLLSPVQTGGLKIAIFPVQNLSGMPAPTREIDLEFAAAVEQIGAHLVDRADVERFIDNRWVRQLGYIDEQTAELLRRDTGADAVLLSNIEVYKEDDNPRFALISRLVSTTDKLPRIIWMESAALNGDENPGLLGLGIITDAKKLRSKVMETICTSLHSFITAPPIRKLLPLASEQRENTPFSLQDQITRISKATAAPLKAGSSSLDLLEKMRSVGGLFTSRYTPLGWFSSTGERNDLQRSLAIVPFINQSTRKNAAELMELHLAKQMVKEGSVIVLELGVIRDKLLKLHIIMDQGISVPAIDSITITLNVDMIMNGKVFDYTESAGFVSAPLLDFYVQVFQRDTRRILWSSYSHNRGDEGVYFYDLNRIASAANLADRMTSALVRKFTEFSTKK